MTVAENLAELGIELPTALGTSGIYRPVRVTGEFAFVSGQLPFDGDTLIARGRVPSEVPLELASKCARQCLINVLGQLASELGSLERVRNVMKIGVFVASDSDFFGQSQIADEASRLLGEILGDSGLHSRIAVGVVALPRESPIEIDAVFELNRE